MFVKLNLMFRGLCFPLDGRETTDAPPPETSVPASWQTFLHRRQLSLMLYLLLVSASGILTGSKVMGAQGWVSSPPLVPQQISQLSDLTSLVQVEEEWIFCRPKGGNESDEEG